MTKYKSSWHYVTVCPGMLGIATMHCKQTLENGDWYFLVSDERIPRTFGFRYQQDAVFFALKFE